MRVEGCTAPGTHNLVVSARKPTPNTVTVMPPLWLASDGCRDTSEGAL